MWTERRKVQVLLLSDGHLPSLPLIHQLDQYFRREEIYLWLINHKVTGKKFYTFCQENSFSHIRIAQYVLSKIDRQKKREIVVGKDLR